MSERLLDLVGIVENGSPEPKAAVQYAVLTPDRRLDRCAELRGIELRHSQLNPQSGEEKLHGMPDNKVGDGKRRCSTN